MNAQLLEYARIELRFALADLSGGTKGQLQAFAENPPADKNLHPRKPIHQIELEGGKTVEADNTALYVLETRSRRRPAPPMNDMEFSLCSWRRAVNALPVYQNSWVKYCYGHDLRFSHQVAFCKHVWSEYEKTLDEKPLQAKIKKRLIALVWLAAQDVAAKSRNDLYKEYAGAALAGFMSINRSTWLRVYAGHWAKLKLLFSIMDMAALQFVLNGREGN